MFIIYKGEYMSERLQEISGDVSAVSNELEFFVQSTNADTVLAQTLGVVEASHEVNRENIVELMISKAPNVHVLNEQVREDVRKLHTIVRNSGGNMYAGSALFQDTSRLEPAWYRTTSLSEQLARGFLDIGSQQLIIGIAREGQGASAGETFGMELYNFLRQLTPVILALSATSPYSYRNGRIVDTGSQSHRPEQYQCMSSRLPIVMFETPVLHSLYEYGNHLQSVSDQVNNRLSHGELDANLDELYRDRGERTYAPFTTLAPHQIYSWVRIRPDHANENSVFSLELRVMDLSSRIETVTALNTFISGLAYYASRYGFDELRNAIAPLGISGSEIQPTLLQVAQTGLDTPVSRSRYGTLIRNLIPPLHRLSKEGLNHRNIPTASMEEEFTHILEHGNGSADVRSFAQGREPSALETENFLISLLARSISAITEGASYDK